MKHSIGKWGLHPLDEFLIITDELKRDIYNRPIAKIDMGYLDHKNEPEANAKLIAAAPELLDTLLWLLENNDLTTDPVSKAKINIAIKKATD